MSLAPFFLWLTIIVGDIDTKDIISLPIFEGILPILSALKNGAENAVGGGSIVFLVVTLYSSTNFFYHLRRSGEIIYESDRVKGGIKLRIISLALMLFTILLIALIVGLSLLGERIFAPVIPQNILSIIIIFFIIFITLVVCILLNIFICPFVVKIKQVLPGSLMTVILWIIFAVGFSLYLQYAHPEKLYGQLASIIIFLLWCYFMTNCFILGVIHNSTYCTVRRHKTLL